MPQYAWPQGEKLTIACPNCNAPCGVHIAVVRDFDGESRPADCFECDAEFELYWDGRTELLFAPPKVSTPEGRELLKTIFVFDPNARD